MEKGSISNYTRTLADFGASTAFEDLPEEIIHGTKRLILDALACSLGACSSDIGATVIKSAESIWGGNGDSTIIGSSARSSIAGAAFTNGELANALDADECFYNFCHYEGVIFSAALAMAERAGASGKDLIAAMALGYEIAGRIGLSLPRAQALTGGPAEPELKGLRTNDWAWQVFGAATAAGRLLGFDGTSMANSYGIAGFNAPVADTKAMKGYDDFLPMTKCSMLGTHALIGVMAALLTDSGFTGNRSILDGEDGFYALIGVDRLYPEILTEKLGEDWVMKGVSFKLYPVCRINHPALDAFFDIIKENGLAPEEIKEITCKMHPRAFGHLDKWPVDSIMDGLGFSFCFPMSFAMAAYGIEPGPDWHLPENVNDPRIKELAGRVKMAPDPDVLKAVYEEVGNEPKTVKKVLNSIEIRTSDGRVFEERREYAKGDPWEKDFVFSDEDLADKMRTYGKEALSGEKIETLINAVSKLEEMDNVRRLSGLIVP